jgi:hypothetical protein
VIAIQLFFWLTLTHIKSRFMLPVVIPAGIAIALALSAIRNPTSHDRQGAKPSIAHQRPFLAIARR